MTNTFLLQEGDFYLYERRMARSLRAMETETRRGFVVQRVSLRDVTREWRLVGRMLLGALIALGCIPGGVSLLAVWLRPLSELGPVLSWIDLGLKVVLIATAVVLCAGAASKASLRAWDNFRSCGTRPDTKRMRRLRQLLRTEPHEFFRLLIKARGPMQGSVPSIAT